MILLAGLATMLLVLLLIPLLAVGTLLGALARLADCTPTDRLALTAPVPAQAHRWVELVRRECAALPGSWVAALMAQESSFQPDAYADDSNGGTWGLLQISQPVWQAAYGGGWATDRNRNGVWDVQEPDIHASVGGRYLCERLDTVRGILRAHPGSAAAQQLSDLDALVIAHNAGESALLRYPTLPAITRGYLQRMRQRTRAWADPTASAGCPQRSSNSGGDASGNGADPGDPVRVPPGTPHTRAQAVRTALSMVGTPSGWYRLCDKLACRIYGYANSGYPSAAIHWRTLLAAGHARPGDPCPPVGAFVYWDTAHVYGHIATVVATDPDCRPDRIKVVTNDSSGGISLSSLAHYTGGSMRYLGWTPPICAGARL
jgi:hypothetical protein